MSKKGTLATRALIADHGYATGREVAPNLSLTTTFRHDPPTDALVTAHVSANPTEDSFNPFEPKHIYSRYTQPTLTRAEKVLGSVIGMPTLLYPSGLAAAFALLCWNAPDVVAVTEGYHGFLHGTLVAYKRIRRNVRVILLDDDYTLLEGEKSLLCWLETPLNPTGESRDIAHYAARAHAIGGKLAVDSTFGPPPLQDPFKWGADFVMHSATKYFAGHSDALAGTLSVRTEAEWTELWNDRTYTGATPGSLEAWLVLRSMRTLDLRVNRQSETATALAYWLSGLTRAFPGSDLDGPAGVVKQVWHSSLQVGKENLVGKGKQMEAGPATFAFVMESPFQAAWLPHCLEIFTPATSLGGVESLIEQRLVSDPFSDPRLIRVSIGLESFEDLKQDLSNGMRKAIAKEKEAGKDRASKL